MSRLRSWPEFFVIICLLLQAVNAGSQTVAAQPSQSRTLTVLAKGSGKPLQRVEVKIGDWTGYSDRDGKVEFQAAEDATVTLSRFGYESASIKLQELSSADNKVFLFPAVPNDNEVIIRGVKRPEVSRKSISAREAARVSPSGDPVQVTKLLPGVQSKSFGNRVIIRGSGPSDSGYFIDAMEIPIIFHTVGGISVMPEPVISDVEFATGGFGPQHGDKHGGIIVLRTRNQVPEEARTEIRVNVPTYSTVFHERPIGDNQSIALSARRSYLEAFLPLVLDSQNAPLTIVPYFADGHALYLKSTEQGYEKGLLMGSIDGIRLAVPLQSATDEDGRGNIDIRNSFVVLGYEWFTGLGDGWSSSLTPYFTYVKNDNQFLNDRVGFDVYNPKLHWEFKKRVSKRASHYIGTELSYVKAKTDISAPSPPDPDDPFFDLEDAPRRRLNDDVEWSTGAVWASRDDELGKFVVTEGMRLFYHSLLEKWQVDPRLSLRYEADSVHTGKAAVGLYSQSPQPPEFAKKFGNPNLGYEKSMHYVLGLESKWSDRWETDVQLFYKTTKDLVVRDSQINYDNKGDRRTRGFEFFVRRNPTEKTFAWLSYTYSVNEERRGDETEYRPSANDQTHVVSLAGSYRISGVWEVAGRMTYHTGDTYTPIADAVYNASLDKYQPRTDGVKPYSRRLPDYHQGDIYATYDFLYDYWKLALRFGVQFLSLTEQVYNIQYNYDYSKKEFFTDVPPIPFVELKGEF